MQPIVLRPNQITVKQGIKDNWDAGFRNIMAVCPTGFGKSIVMSDIVYDWFVYGRRVAVIAHRNELVSQMSMHLARRGIKHKLIASDTTIKQITRKHRNKFSGKCFIDPSAPVAVVGVDTLMARTDELTSWAEQVELWIIDECFPAGTPIRTENGDVAIEDIRLGDTVLSYDERSDTFHYRKVTRLFKNPIPDYMMRLTISNGSIMSCTPNHPILIKDKGWVLAHQIIKGDYVLYAETSDNDQLYSLFEDHRYRQGLEDSDVLQNGSRVLLPRMYEGAHAEGVIGNDESYEQAICFRPYVKEEPYASRRSPKKGFEDTQINGSSTKTTWWEWTRAPASGEDTDVSLGACGFSQSICHSHGYGEIFGLPIPLQSRFSTPADENSDRSGWDFAQFFRTTSPGCQENNFLRVERVESFKVSEQDDRTRHYDGFVYNIEVDEFHTYVANGIVVHNCHHTIGDPNEPANCDPNKWGKAVKMFKNAIGLGVTATPQRADGKGLGAHHDGVFEAMVLGPPMRELIQNGDLAEYEIVCPASDLDVSGENLSANGDWSSQTLKKAAKKSHIVGDVVANYIKYANGRQAIVFATDVETSGDIAKSFNESGIRAMSLSAKTHTDIREKAMSDFESGILNVLVNVDLFDEGVDCGSLDVVIMARPTNSLAKYLQQVGRALRPRAGKVALIIDHVSNVVLHGLPDKIHKWTLDRRDKRAEGVKDPDDIPLRACTGCSKVYEKFRTACPHCGTEVPLPTPRERTVEMVEGDLILLDRAMLEQMRKAAEPESPESMQSRVGFVAGEIAGKAAFNRQFDKIVAHTRLKEVIAQWAAIERQRGFTDSEIQRKFFHTVGVDVLTALDGSQTRGEIEAMAERIEGWYKRD